MDFIQTEIQKNKNKNLGFWAVNITESHVCLARPYVRNTVFFPNIT